MRKKRREDHDFFDNGDDAGFDYRDIYQDTEEEEIEALRGEVVSGDCMYCQAKNGMKFQGNCFICSECKQGVQDELYYRWLAGYPIETDDDDWDDIYD